MVKKWLYYLSSIALALSLCLSTSAPAEAIGVSINVTPIGSWPVTSAFQTYNACTYNNSTQPAYATNNGSSACTTSMQLRGIGGLGFNQNYVFGITQYFYELRDREPINDYINQSSTATVYNNTGALWVADFLGYEVNNFSESANAVTFYFRFSQAQSGTFTNDSWMEIQTYPGVQPNEFVRAPSEIKLYSVPDGYDSQGIINAINDLEITVEGSSGVTSEEMTNIINSQTESINNPEWRDDEREEMQTSQDDAQDSADDSQDDVDSATTSLLDVVRQFVNAVVSASPTSCVLNGDLIPHLPLGSLDLCKESPPPAVTALGSLLLISFVVPLAYNTVKTIINLIGEFQR